MTTAPRRVMDKHRRGALGKAQAAAELLGQLRIADAPFAGDVALVEALLVARQAALALAEAIADTRSEG